MGVDESWASGGTFEMGYLHANAALDPVRADSRSCWCGDLFWASGGTPGAGNFDVVKNVTRGLLYVFLDAGLDNKKHPERALLRVGWICPVCVAPMGYPCEGLKCTFGVPSSCIASFENGV